MNMGATKIQELLKDIIYPETGVNIVESGILAEVKEESGELFITLEFTKPTDPFLNSIKKSVKEKLENNFGSTYIINIVTKTKKSAKPKIETTAGVEEVANIIAIASGKGGVGKSTITVNLAVALAQMGYKCGVVDADIFGPSIPKMFGIENEKPGGVMENGKELIVPVEKYGIKILSIGFFIDPKDATIWRGPMASGVLKQFIYDTKWGKLDFLLFDLPPGTSDIHLTLVQSVPVTGAVIVSTPQQVAIADARKGVAMFRANGINVPVLGIVENMAWFTPEELPENKYYIFGKGGVEQLAAETQTQILGQIPIVQSICESGDNGKPVASNPKTIQGKAFEELAIKFVEAVEKRNKELPKTQQVIVK